MVSRFTVLISILLASVVLSVPSSRLEARLARRRENRQSKLINRIDTIDASTNGTQYSSNWAGAVHSEKEGTFTNVTGNFIIPALKGPSGSASAWVGIDGDTCENAILQTGVDFTIKGGKSSYDAWYEWYPDDSHDFHNFTVKAGDEIRTTVTSSSKRSGKAVIENLTTSQTVTKELSSSYSLCGQDAEWIVEYFDDDVDFVDFGTVRFTNATASGNGKTRYTPDGATIYDIQDTDVLTSVSVSGDIVTVKYVAGQ